VLEDEGREAIFGSGYIMDQELEPFTNKCCLLDVLYANAKTATWALKMVTKSSGGKTITTNNNKTVKERHVQGEAVPSIIICRGRKYGLERCIFRGLLHKYCTYLNRAILY
jgi:hypothetical protein